MNIKRIAILSASPKMTAKSASQFLSERVQAGAGDGVQADIIRVRDALARNQTDAAFETMHQADALVIIFPLYVFCLPGMLMRFLQLYHAHTMEKPLTKPCAVYAVVNCGFPEADINGEAMHVIHRFADAIGASFRQGILIGGGGMMMVNVKPAKKLISAFDSAVQDINRDVMAGSLDEKPPVLLEMAFPRRLYFLMGNMGWGMQIRRNHLKKSDLRAQPYRPAENA